MCGFTGIIKPRNDKFQSIKALELSKDIISHRGNDKSKTFINEDKGIYLAFNRLSIVDTEERSSQPMIYTHHNKSIIGMLNGEIYNYLEIKSNLIKKGYHFTTTSDTEVLLALMIDKGIDGINSLQGIFSIFIYFQDLEKIFLIRDQIGVKPLYFAYGIKDWNFLFASEIKAFHPFMELAPKIDKLSEFSVFGEIADHETIYKNIYQIQPGEILEIDLNNNFKISKKEYFSLIDFYLGQNLIDNRVNIETLCEDINDTVIIQSNIDVPHGILLSGGLDSSLIAGIIKNKKELKSYSAVVENKELSEEYWQNKVAKYLSIKNYKTIMSCKSYSEKILKDYIKFNDAPLYHPNFIPCFEMCKSANSDNLKVLLSGDGADEFFSGYKWLSPSNDLSSIENIINASAFNSTSSISKLFNKKSIDISSRIEYLKKFNDKNFPNYNLILSHIYMQRYYLQKWLHRQDRTGMANSIEIRVPFCDIKLLKNYIKLRAKSINEIAGNKLDLKQVAIKYLPEDVVYRKKLGFPLPLEDLFSGGGFLGSITKQIVEKKFFKHTDIFNLKFASELAENHLNKKEFNGRILWTMYNSEIWLRSILD